MFDKITKTWTKIIRLACFLLLNILNILFFFQNKIVTNNYTSYALSIILIIISLFKKLLFALRIFKKFCTFRRLKFYTWRGNNKATISNQLI